MENIPCCFKLLELTIFCSSVFSSWVTSVKALMVNLCSNKTDRVNSIPFTSPIMRSNNKTQRVNTKETSLQRCYRCSDVSFALTLWIDGSTSNKDFAPESVGECSCCLTWCKSRHLTVMHGSKALLDAVQQLFPLKFFFKGLSKG